MYTYKMTSFTENLLNAGSKIMNVNGSVTPQIFSYSPSGTTTVAILGMTCLFNDEGTTSLTKFGAITVLTNGLLVESVVDSTTSQITNIKDNSDLCTRFMFNQFGNSAVLSVLSIVTPVGFGNTNNVFIGYLEFRQPLVLNGSSDSIKATVRDNLSGIDLLNISINGVVLV